MIRHTKYVPSHLYVYSEIFIYFYIHVKLRNVHNREALSEKKYKVHTNKFIKHDYIYTHSNWYCMFILICKKCIIIILFYKILVFIVYSNII